MEKIFSWARGKILEIDVPDSQEWIPQLIDQFSQHLDGADKSHKIGGRWENLYLNIDLVPTCRVPIRFARDMGLEFFKKSSVIFYEPLTGSGDVNPPFWFNLAKPGESTGVHDHAHLSILSGVVYLSCSPSSGNLFFHKEDEMDLDIMPSEGKLVLFEPWMRHGVRENRSSEERLSLVFNLFPFPLPIKNL